MITNERQYAMSEMQLKKCFSLRHKYMQNTEAHKPELEQSIERLSREIESLISQMREYRSLTSGHSTPPDLSQISNLPGNLIRARIALGWSQKQLAKQCRVVPSQVHRWESTCYRNVCLARVLSIAELLDSKLKEDNRATYVTDRPLKLACDWFDLSTSELRK